jgi:hypothetical protein
VGFARSGVAVLCAASLAGSVLAERSARAEPATVLISYQADAGCPPADAFLATVREKTPNVALAPPGAPARFAVIAMSGAAQSVARLTSRGVDLRTTTRDLAGASCADVVRAIALTTSLAITYESERTPLGPAAPPPEPPRTPVAPPDVSPRARTHLLVGASASLNGGLGAKAAFSESIFMQGDLAAATWPASLRLSASYANRTRSNDPAWGSADFQAMIAGLEVCPYRVEIDPRLRLLPAVRFEGGVQLASGNVAMAGGRSGSFQGTFGALGPLLRAQALLGGVVLEADAGLRFPLSRYSFEIEAAPASAAPAKTVYDVPAVAGFGGLGLGVEFF